MAQPSPGEYQFYEACRTGELAEVRRLAGLLGDGINWANPDQDGKTGFHVACVNSDPQVAEFLLTLPQLNPNLRDMHGRAALEYACTTNINRFLLMGSEQLPTTLSWLIGHPRIDIAPALWLVGCCDMEEILGAFLASGKPFDVEAAIRSAQAIGNETLVRMLLTGQSPS